MILREKGKKERKRERGKKTERRGGERMREWSMKGAKERAGRKIVEWRDRAVALTEDCSEIGDRSRRDRLVQGGGFVLQTLRSVAGRRSDGSAVTVAVEYQSGNEACAVRAKQSIVAWTVGGLVKEYRYKQDGAPRGSRAAARCWRCSFEWMRIRLGADSSHDPDWPGRGCPRADCRAVFVGANPATFGRLDVKGQSVYPGRHW